MACSSCETTFNGNQPIVVSIVKSGTTALLYVQNQGRNIVQLRRILLCYAPPGGGASVLYLRPPPDPISWGPNAFLEPGTTALYYSLSGVAAGNIVQAQAEYIEFEGRSRSCPTTM